MVQKAKCARLEKLILVLQDNYYLDLSFKWAYNIYLLERIRQMKYKVTVYDNINQRFTRVIDTKDLKFSDDEEWWSLTSDEREACIIEEMYYLTTAFAIVDIKYEVTL